jgi:hypothetical protein
MELDKGNGKDHANGNGHAAADWRPTPYPEVEKLSLDELRVQLAHVEDNFAIAKQHGAEDIFLCWLDGERNLLIAEIKRRESALYGQKENHTEPSEVVFPEAAWSGLFADWREVVAPCTEAALEKLWVVMLMAVGLMLGRNVWLENPQQVF